MTTSRHEPSQWEAGPFRKLVKNVAHRIIPRLTRRYIQSGREFHLQGLVLQVPPGVFHPGLYFSTKLLAKYLLGQPIKGAKILEIGAGSGMISLLCAKAGAYVTATDISPLAVETIRQNAQDNHLELAVLESDLFQSIPPGQYDWIVVNPPYFPGTPQNIEEYAWYCGPDFEYFDGFFGRYREFLAEKGTTLMILSEDCKIGKIAQIASHHDTFLALRHKRWVMGEWNYIFELQQLQK